MSAKKLYKCGDIIAATVSTNELAISHRVV